jgi:hypothetical protein
MPGPEITPDLIAALATGVLSLVSPCAWPVVFAVLFLAALTVLTPVQGERPGLLARLVPVHLFFLCIGEVPEWPKGADCKSAGSAFGGSNPPLSTIEKFARCCMDKEDYLSNYTTGRNLP